MTWMSQIESLLFVRGDEGLTLQQLCELLKGTESEIKDTLQQLEQKLLEDETRGLLLKKIAGGYQLITKSENADTIRQLIESPSMQQLSQAAMEVLAIVAYNQPITRVEIENIRGVKSDRPLQTLIGRALIQEVGRAEGTGRAILYGTTQEFLQFFGLNELTDLPPLQIPDEESLDDETDLFLSKFQELLQEEE